ncbi:MAG: fumarylacetoacetate hydrolase family protein, partial [Betaproteobacteria bacterium]|nr:fumarylacetoacetate hydrolase family protein [Betaproteobacteria bacterium]
AGTSQGPVGQIADPQQLRIWLELNGRMRQDSSTANMIFPVARLVSYLSEFMTLEPGDLIATGTPAGVGMGCRPPEYLVPGMQLRLGIDGLGEQLLTTVAERGQPQDS